LPHVGIPYDGKGSKPKKLDNKRVTTGATGGLI
jgi:hypothetical protein